MISNPLQFLGPFAGFGTPAKTGDRNNLGTVQEIYLRLALHTQCAADGKPTMIYEEEQPKRDP